MPGTVGPNIGFTWGYSPGENGWGVGGFNPNWARVDTLLFLAVISQTATPPGTPANGDRYIVGASATGAWVGQDNKVAVWLTTGTPAWVFYDAKVNWRAFNIDTASYFRYNGSDWLEEPTVSTETHATDYAVLTSDSGKHFNNIGAVGTVIFSLPPAAAGLEFSFAVYVTQILRVLANTGDQIAIGDLNSAAAGNVESNLPFSSIKIECHDGAQWIASSSIGSWTVA